MSSDASSDAMKQAGLLDGLHGRARRDRAELIAWLLDRGFGIDQISDSLAPMMLPLSRVLGDDTGYVSAREVAQAVGIELDLLQRLQRAVGLPRVDDPDTAVLPRADAEIAARTAVFADFTVDVDDAVAVVRVLADGLHRTAALMREVGYRMLLEPGASELVLAKAAEDFAHRATAELGPILESLLLLELRHVLMADGIGAAELAAGTLPGSQYVAVAFADMAGFTQMGEAFPPEAIARLAGRLAELTHETVATPVSFVKSIGDAVMLVCPDTALLIATVLDLVHAAAGAGLPQLHVGVSAGRATSRAGDWFGSPVNLASRISRVAKPGTVLVSGAARDISRTAADFKWRSVGAYDLKGVSGLVDLHEVTSGP